MAGSNRPDLGEPEPRQWKPGDRVTVSDLSRGTVWNGRVVSHPAGDKYVIVEDDAGLHWRVGVGFVAVAV